MTTTRTWIGGGNNRASNPRDWSPTGAPQPADNLAVAGGTINIAGGDLRGDNLILTLGGPRTYTGPVTVNLSHHAPVNAFVSPYVAGTSVTFNVTNSALNLMDGTQFASTADPTINLKGADTFHLNVIGGSQAHINLLPRATWIGDIYVHALGNHDYGGNVVVKGPANASFNNEASEIDSGATTINANVVGIGTFGMGLKDSYPGHSATLEFIKSVGYGQTVTMSDAAHYANSGLLLQLDHPTDFHGNVVLTQGTIDLVGLAAADSYSFKNDMLSIYNGQTVIDTLRLHDTTPHGFAVETMASSLYVVAISDPANPPTGLPIHV